MCFLDTRPWGPTWIHTRKPPLDNHWACSSPPSNHPPLLMVERFCTVSCSLSVLNHQSSNRNSVSSTGGCPYLYSRCQDNRFLFIRICSINMSLLKINIPFLSWPPSSSSSFHFSFIRSLCCVIDVVLRRFSAFPSHIDATQGHCFQHSWNGLCRVRGHLWRKECMRAPLRVQRLQPLPRCAVLPAS